MAASITEIVDQLRAALAISDPDLDTSVGTTTRKMIDAWAESLAESYLDQHMLAYTYDVDSKVEGDLDSFCQTVGGIARLAAKRATGTATFVRAGAPTATVLIPVNTQINSVTLVAVQAITGATILPGQTSVTVAVQAVNAGPEGNLAADSLVALSDVVEGIASVTNVQPLTGGTLQETDNELRARWKRTAFRSMAGTESMYLGTALNDRSVTAAQVTGSSKRRREQVQVAAGVAQSVVDDAVYVFPVNVAVGGNIDNGTLLLRDVDYTWDSTTLPPRVLINSGLSTYDPGNGEPPQPIEGGILDLEFDYTPLCSRNDPTGLRYSAGSVMNRVDIWCAGQRLVSAQQSVVFQSTLRFTGDTASPYYTGRYRRLASGAAPVANNVFLRLAFGPIAAVPDVLSIGGTTYGQIGSIGGGAATNPDAYAVVHDDSAFGYASNSLFGLEFDAAMLPADDTVFTLGASGGYLYNEVPQVVQSEVNRWRLVGVDALAHAARQIELRFSLAVMYQRSASQASVNGDIDTAISTYLGRTGLGGIVQVSDIEAVVHEVSGVDNVRFLTGLDYQDWDYALRDTFNVGIQRSISGVVVESYISIAGRPYDIVFADNEVPVFEQAHKTVKAQNTFGFA